MFRSPSKSKTTIAAALLLTMLSNDWWANSADAQDSTAATPANESIQQWIQELRSPLFKTRKAASDALRKAGDAAIEPLKKAEPAATPEHKIRIQLILKALQQNTFAGRLDRLKKTPSVKLAEELPEWPRFAKIVGSDEKSVDLYIRLLSAEPALFTAVMNNSRDLPTMLQARAAEILQAARPTPVRAHEFSVDSYAALLLLLSDNNRRARGDTSTSISRLLDYPLFTSALKRPEGKALLRLAGAYILRERIAVERPLTFARDFPMAEGLTLARRVLKNALRGHNGLYAMVVLREQGDKSDIALLESLFEHPGILTKGRRTALNNVVVTYVAFNGDLALAVAITMRGGDPRDYGFGKGEPRDGDFRFDLATIGFDSDQERQQAFQMYKDRFLKKNVPVQK